MRDRSYAVVMAAFATVFYCAMLFAAFGLIAALFNRDVVAGGGPLVGPTMFTVASVLTFGFLATIGVAIPAQRQRVAPGAAVAVAFVAYFAFIVTGGILTASGDEQPLHFTGFVLSMLGSPFAIVVGVLAFVVTLLYQLVLAGRFRDRAEPRWPWERHDD